jgi:hypothetical protein
MGSGWSSLPQAFTIYPGSKVLGKPSILRASIAAVNSNGDYMVAGSGWPRLI